MLKTCPRESLGNVRQAVEEHVLDSDSGYVSTCGTRDLGELLRVLTSRVKVGDAGVEVVLRELVKGERER